MKTWGALFGIAAVAVLAGCAAKAPNYNPNPESAQRLQAARVQPAAVGEFKADANVSDTSIGLRASTMVPEQGTFSQYLADAIKNELDLVKLYSPSSTTVISGVLMKNEMNTGVAMTGEGAIEARFVVKRDGAVRFDKLKKAAIQWDTNYFGAIAIPRAQNEYTRLVQALVAELFSDPDFVAALK
jgi:hypothetical protein